MLVTREELRKYQFLKLEITTMQVQIEAMYIPVGSPPTEIIGARSTTPGDPTAEAVQRIEALQERMRKKIAEYVELTERIEMFVETVDDGYVRSIIRLHFLIGLTWRKTCEKVYGYKDPEVCRSAYNRYMSKREKEEEDARPD